MTEDKDAQREVAEVLLPIAVELSGEWLKFQLAETEIFEGAWCELLKTN